jgi:lupus La protein
VKSVRLPRHPVNKSAASGFAVVEFSSEEEAQKVLGMELISQGAALELEPKYDASVFIMLFISHFSFSGISPSI